MQLRRAFQRLILHDYLLGIQADQAFQLRTFGKGMPAESMHAFRNFHHHQRGISQEGPAADHGHRLRPVASL